MLQENREDIIRTSVIESYYDLFDDRASGQSFVNELIQIFSKNGETTLRDMHTAHTAGNFTQVARLAHKLKGMSHNIGADRLAVHCERLEDTAEQATTDAIKRMITSIETAFCQIQVELRDKFYRAA